VPGDRAARFGARWGLTSAEARSRSAASRDRRAQAELRRPERRCRCGSGADGWRFSQFAISPRLSGGQVSVAGPERKKLLAGAVQARFGAPPRDHRKRRDAAAQRERRLWPRPSCQFQRRQWRPRRRRCDLDLVVTIRTNSTFVRCGKSPMGADLGTDPGPGAAGDGEVRIFAKDDEWGLPGGDFDTTTQHRR